MASRCISDSRHASDGLRAIAWISEKGCRDCSDGLRRSMPCEENVYQNQYEMPTTKMLPTVRNRISGATLIILATGLFTVVWSSARVGRRALVGESSRD